MADEQKSFKPLSDSTEPRPRARGGGAVVPDNTPQTLIYELRKRDRTTQRRAVKDTPRIRAAFKRLTWAARKRIVAVGLWVLALGAAADFAYWALVEDERPAERSQMSLADTQQERVPVDVMRVAPSSPEERSVQTVTNTPSDPATDQATNAPSPPPARSAAAPASNGGYVVQVSSERSDTEAQASFKSLQSKYPGVLGGRSPLIRRVDLGEKGIVYRTQVGPFETVDEAKQLCGSLKAAGGHCIVQRNS
jgi:cell division septation protein DedD